MTSIRWAIFVGVGATVALSAATAEAKCGFRRYRVEVEFRSHATGDPVPGVQLGVFVNGSEGEMPIIATLLMDPLDQLRNFN